MFGSSKLRGENDSPSGRSNASVRTNTKQLKSNLTPLFYNAPSGERRNHNSSSARAENLSQTVINSDRLRGGGVFLLSNGVLTRPAVSDPVWERIKYVPRVKRYQRYGERAEGDSRFELVGSQQSLPVLNRRDRTPVVRDLEFETRHQHLYVYPDISSFPFGDFHYRSTKMRTTSTPLLPSRTVKPGFSKLCSDLRLSPAKRIQMKEIWDSVQGSASERMRKSWRLWNRGKRGDAFSPVHSSVDDPSSRNAFSRAATGLDKSLLNERTLRFRRSKLLDLASLITEKSCRTILSSLAPEFFSIHYGKLSYQAAHDSVRDPVLVPEGDPSDPGGFDLFAPPVFPDGIVWTDEQLADNELDWMCGDILCDLGFGITYEEEVYKTTLFNYVKSRNDLRFQLTDMWMHKEPVAHFLVELVLGEPWVAEGPLELSPVSYDRFLWFLETGEVITFQGAKTSKPSSFEPFTHRELFDSLVENSGAPDTPEFYSAFCLTMEGNEELYKQLCEAMSRGDELDAAFYGRLPAREPVLEAPVPFSLKTAFTELPPPTLDFDRVFRDLFFSVTGTKLTCGASDLVNIYVFVTTSDTLTRFLVGTSILGSRLLNDVIRHLGWHVSNIRRLVESFDPSSLLSFQSLDPLILIFKRIKNADIFKQGGVALLSAIALGFFEHPAIAYFVSESSVREFMNGAGKGGVVMDLLMSVTKLLNRVIKFLKTGDVCALFPDDSIEGIVAQGEYIKSELAAIGVSTFDPAEALAHSIQFVNKHSGSVNPVVRSLVREIMAERSSLMKVLSSERPAPFGVIVAGQPGTGKTHFCKQFANFVCIDQKVPAGISGVFEYNTTNYQDVPPVVAAAIVNDYFSLVAESKLSKEDPISFLQSMVDIFPVKVESAAVEDKEKSYLYHSAVLVTSNVQTYSCSQSASGVDKLDRRYRVVSMSYNEEAIRAAGMTMEQFVSRATVEGYEFVEPFVQYSVGFMANKPGPEEKTLDLTPKISVEKFDTYEAFFLHMRGLYAKHRAKVKIPKFHCLSCRIKLEGFETPCNCGLYGLTREVQALEPVSQSTKNELFTTLMSMWDMMSVRAQPPAAEGALVLQGNGPLVGFVIPERGLTALDAIQGALNNGVRITHSIPFFEHLIGAAEFTKGFLKGIAIGGSIALAIKLVDLLLTWAVNRNQQQGSIASVVNVPAVFNPVQTFDKNVNPWLNPNLAGGWCDIENLNTGVKMHASLLTTRCLLFPGHLVAGSSPGIYTGPDISFKLTLSASKSQTVVMSTGRAWFSHRINGDTLCFFYVPNFALPLRELLSSTHYGDAAIGDLVVGGHRCEKVRCTAVDISYKISLGDGSCGLPIFDSRGQFYGIHHAIYNMPRPDGSRVSVGMLFFRDHFAEATRALHSTGCILFSNAPVVEWQGDFLGKPLVGVAEPHPSSDVGKFIHFSGRDEMLQSRHLPLGYFKRIAGAKMSCRETRMHSAFREKVEECGKPHTGKAILVDGVWCSADLGRLRNMSVDCDYDHTAVMKAVNDYYMRFDFSQFKKSPVGPLSDYQAFVGDPRNAAMNSRDPTKSIGPYLQSLKLKKEEVFAKLSEGEYEICPELLKDMASWEEHLGSREPLRAPTVVGTLKDEPYPIDKVKQGKARYFYVLDAAVNLVQRKYLLPIMAFLVAQPTKSRMYTMMNATGVDFENLHKTLMRNGDGRAFDLDQKGMDLHNAVFWEPVAWLLAKIASSLGYTGEECYMVERCILVMKATMLMMNDNLFYSWAYLSSGCSFTIVFNCLCGELLLSSIYYQNNPHELSGAFSRYFQTAHVGDDVVATVSTMCSFDPQLFVVNARRWGYEVTNGRKDPIVQFCRLEDLTFLKRTFKNHNGRIVGPLAKQSIYKALSYCTGISPKDVAKEDERNIGTLRSQLRECVLHDESMFDEILKVAQVFYPSENFPSYSDLLMEMEYGDYMTWTNHPIGKTKIGEDNASLDSRAGGPEGDPLFSGGLTLQAQHHPQVDRRVAWALTRVTEQHTSSSPSTLELNASQSTMVMASSEPVTEFATSATSSTDVGPGRSVIVRTKPDSALELADYFARPRLVATVAANSTTGYRGSAFTTWRALPTVTAFLGKWSQFRGDVVVTVVVTGSTQVQGKWRLALQPARHVDNYSDYVYTPVIDAGFWPMTSVLPHVDIDLSAVGSYTIKLPYPSQHPFLSIVSASTDYYINLMPINAMQSISGATPPPFPMEVWVSYSNVLLDVLRYQGFGGELTFQGGDDNPRLISSIAHYASAIAAKAPFPWASPAALVLKLGAYVAEAFGYSRPYEEISAAMISRHVQNYSVMSGQSDFSYTMGADPRATTSVDSSVIPFSRKGETNVKDVARRWGQVLKSAGLFSYSSNPLGSITYTDSTPFTYVFHSPLQYMTRLFTYYTGSIDYCLEFVTSPLVRWRVGVAIFPPGVTPSVAFPTNGSVITYIVEVVGSTCFEFNVPYMFRSDFFPTLDGNASGITPPTIKLYSLMDANGPSATPVYPSVNLYHRAGPDFELAQPTLKNFSSYVAIDGVSWDWTLQGTGPKSQAVFGEVTEDLVALTKRKTLYLSPTNVGQGYAFNKPVPPLNSSGLVHGYPVNWTYQSLIAPMFWGENGSFSWLVVDAANSNTYASAIYGTEATYLPFFQLNVGRGMQVIPNESGGEFRLPNRSPTPFRTTSKAGYGTFITENILFYVDRVAVSALPLRIMVGAGDDYMVGGFICPPVLTAD